MSTTTTTPLAALLSALDALTQTTRILRQHVAEDAPLVVRSMVPYQLAGTETVCGNARYRLQLICRSAHVSLKDLLGLPMAASIADDKGGQRVISGFVHRPEVLLSDGASTLVELGLCDALSLLRLRKNRRIFRDLSVIEVVSQILSEHIRANPVLGKAFKFNIDNLRKTYPARALIHQAGESDAAFIERLCKQEGISWHFKHALDEGQPTQTLILGENTSAFSDSPAGTVRFHRADATEKTDTVVAWQAWRELSPESSQRAQFNYKSVQVDQSEQPSLLDQGPKGDDLARTLTDYHYDEPVLAAGGEHRDQMSRSRIQAHEFTGKGFRGEGVVRQFACGTAFGLDSHYEIDQHPAEERQFTLTHVDLYARNNVPLDDRLGRSLFPGWQYHVPRDEATGTVPSATRDAPLYYNRFECVRALVPVIPTFDPDADVPRVHFMSAIVANENGQEFDVDDQGRVCVRFLFSHDEAALHSGGGAPAPLLNSARVRVMQTLAAPGFGSTHWPRDGMEVKLAFDEGHPDKPFIVGMVYNGKEAPAKYAHRPSVPANAPLTGLRTKEVGCERYNHLRFSDFTGKIGSQIATDHAATQLNQGWLGTPFDEGMSDPRGEGFEHITDASGAIRTRRGLLLSAFGRAQASGKQMDRQETLTLMRECVTLFEELGNYAAQHEGRPVDTQGQADQKTKLENWERGSNTEPGGAGGGAPMVAITAPAGLHLNTPASVVTHAGETVDTVAIGNVQTTSGGHHVTNAGQGVSTFAQSGGIKTVAHQGDHLMQSQSANTFIQSAKDLGLSATLKIHLMAGDEVLIGEGGGSYIRMGGGRIEMGAPSGFFVKAPQHVWDDAASGSVQLPEFSIGELGRVPTLVRPTDGGAIPGVDFEMSRSVSGPASGKTDAQGRGTQTVTKVFEKLKTTFRFKGNA